MLIEHVLLKEKVEKHSCFLWRLFPIMQLRTHDVYKHLVSKFGADNVFTFNI